MILYDIMKKYASRRALSFHTPGHKGVLSELDITELDIDGIGSTNSYIEKAEQITAEYYGALKTYYLVGGTTSGVLNIIDSLPKGRLIIARASHKSIFNGCILSNIEPIIIDNEVINGISKPLTPEQIERAVRANPDAIGAFITTPNYFGQTTDLAAIREILADKILAVDSAHGAHCGAHPLLPENATKYADVCVLSAHKTLPVLTQAAYLNITSQALLNPIRRTTELTRTTSPSFLLLASLEYGTDYLKNNSEKFADLIGAIKKYIPESLPTDDPTKIVIDLEKLGISGYAADYYLQSKNIFCEFGNPRYIMFIVSIMDTVENIKFLGEKLKELYADAHKLPKADKSILHAVKVARARSFTESTFTETELVPLKESLNRISAVEAGLFPPCLPVIARGEIISQEVIDILSSLNSFGLSGNGKEIEVLK